MEIQLYIWNLLSTSYKTITLLVFRNWYFKNSNAAIHTFYTYMSLKTYNETSLIFQTNLELSFSCQMWSFEFEEKEWCPRVGLVCTSIFFLFTSLGFASFFCVRHVLLCLAQYNSLLALLKQKCNFESWCMGWKLVQCSLLLPWTHMEVYYTWKGINLRPGLWGLGAVSAWVPRVCLVWARRSYATVLKCAQHQVDSDVCAILRSLCTCTDTSFFVYTPCGIDVQVKFW